MSKHFLLLPLQNTGALLHVYTSIHFGIYPGLYWSKTDHLRSLETWGTPWHARNVSLGGHSSSRSKPLKFCQPKFCDEGMVVSLMKCIPTWENNTRLDTSLQLEWPFAMFCDATLVWSQWDFFSQKILFPESSIPSPAPTFLWNHRMSWVGMELKNDQAPNPLSQAGLPTLTSNTRFSRLSNTTFPD